MAARDIPFLGLQGQQKSIPLRSGAPPRIPAQSGLITNRGKVLWNPKRRLVVLMRDRTDIPAPVAIRYIPPQATA
jgi:hypothetical protein